MTLEPQQSENQTPQELDSQMRDLIAEAQHVNQEITDAAWASSKEINALDLHVKTSIAAIQKMHASLDQAEEEAVAEFDKLLLEESEELGKE